MHRVVFDPDAEAQLIDLEHYVAGDASPEIAARFITTIVDACRRLAIFPRRGTPRDDLRPGVRTFVVRRRTTVAYAVVDNDVLILGVFYGGQDYAAVFRGDRANDEPEGKARC